MKRCRLPAYRCEKRIFWVNVWSFVSPPSFPKLKIRRWMERKSFSVRQNLSDWKVSETIFWSLLNQFQRQKTQESRDKEHNQSNSNKIFMFFPVQAASSFEHFILVDAILVFSRLDAFQRICCIIEDLCFGNDKRTDIFCDFFQFSDFALFIWISVSDWYIAVLKKVNRIYFRFMFSQYKYG